MSKACLILMVDWSARSARSPAKPTKDAIHVAETGPAGQFATYCRSRAEAQAHLEARFDMALARGWRVVAGFDFPFGYPRGFARAVTGSDDPFALWAWLSDAVTDDDRNGNNRLEVADRINAMLPGGGPFWSHPVSRNPAHVPFRKPPHHGYPFSERRKVETIATGASTCFQLYGNGAVASQTLLGLPRLQALRRRYGHALAVRPFEDRDAPILLAEVYPSLLDPEVRARQRPGEIRDAAQVRVLAAAFAGLDPAHRDSMLREGDREEGWIAGLGHEAALAAALG